MDNTRSIEFQAGSPIDALTRIAIERRRADVRILTAANRAALEAYKQHVIESIDRVLALQAPAEAWARAGGEAPEIARRYAATARAAWEDGAANHDERSRAEKALGEFLGVGFASLIDETARVALGWVTGYVMDPVRHSTVESALDELCDNFMEETNNGLVVEKVMDAAYAAAQQTAASLMGNEPASATAAKAA